MSLISESVENFDVIEGHLKHCPDNALRLAQRVCPALVDRKFPCHERAAFVVFHNTFALRRQIEGAAKADGSDKPEVFFESLAGLKSLVGAMYPKCIEACEQSPDVVALVICTRCSASLVDSRLPDRLSTFSATCFRPRLPPADSKACASCGKSDGTAPKRCSRCHQVRYCGQRCQREDWARHKLTCDKPSGD